MNNTPTNPELTSGISPESRSSFRGARGRFQVIVEYPAGACFPTVTAHLPEEGVEAFMAQAPGCEEGEIALFDCYEQCVVASVKWKMTETELGLRVPQRQNIFHDWNLGLIAAELKKRGAARSAE